MKALGYCANCGPGVPVDPPSKVICKKCQQAITRELSELCKRLAEAERLGGVGEDQG